VTEHDIARIEKELGVRLPAAYRSLVCPFPVRAYAGNVETLLWDDPTQIINLNRELRAGRPSLVPWAPHVFALGRDDSGCASAIDLRQSEPTVKWVDRCNLGVADADEGPLQSWADAYLRSLRADTEDDGINPDLDPQARAEHESRQARRGCRLMLYLVLFSMLGIVGLTGVVVGFRLLLR